MGTAVWPFNKRWSALANLLDYASETWMNPKFGPDNVVRISLHGLEYEVDVTEFEYLQKIPEEERLWTLCQSRYEHHVLSKGGKKKVDPVYRAQSRQAIRFAITFIRVGMGEFKNEKGTTAGNGGKIQEGAKASGRSEEKL